MSISCVDVVRCRAPFNTARPVSFTDGRRDVGSCLVGVASRNTLVDNGARPCTATGAQNAAWRSTLCTALATQLCKASWRRVGGKRLDDYAVGSCGRGGVARLDNK